VRNIRLRYWPSTRAVWVLGCAAFLLAASPGVRLFALIAYALVAALAVALVYDGLRLPRRVNVRRLAPPHFALRRTIALPYRI
jgi:hypothetical protein